MDTPLLGCSQLLVPVFFRGRKGDPTSVLGLFCPPSGPLGVDLEQSHPMDLEQRGLVADTLATGKAVVAADSTGSGY